MSLFNPNIIQDESDLQRVRREEYIKKMMSLLVDNINSKSKHSRSHYIVVSKEVAKMWQDSNND